MNCQTAKWRVTKLFYRQTRGGVRMDSVKKRIINIIFLHEVPKKPRSHQDNVSCILRQQIARKMSTPIIFKEGQ